jgi:hypothetical protein
VLDRRHHFPGCRASNGALKSLPDAAITRAAAQFDPKNARGFLVIRS